MQHTTSTHIQQSPTTSAEAIVGFREVRGGTDFTSRDAGTERNVYQIAANLGVGASSGLDRSDPKPTEQGGASPGNPTLLPSAPTPD